MHEELWWYLYISILNEEGKRKKEIFDIINSLLPWLNYDLWKANQEKETEGQENNAFAKQYEDAQKGIFDTPIDELLIDELVDPDTFKQIFVQNQTTGSIKDRLFNNNPIGEE